LAGQNPHYNTDAKLDGVNVAKLLDAFPNARGKMTGTLEGNVKLDGEVTRSPHPLAGIHGSGQMAIRNGKLPSLLLNKNLLQLAQLAKMGPGSGDPGSFSSIAMDFTIANERINTTKATIVGNGVDVDASGSLALAGEGSLDCQGVARVAATQNALSNLVANLSGATFAKGKMVFPFKLAGTPQNPKFTLKSGGAGGQLGAITGAPGQKGATARQQKP
jgi:AsmA protein